MVTAKSSDANPPSDLVRACIDAGFLLRQALAAVLDAYGVTPEQQEVLGLVAAGHVTAHALAAASGRDKTTVSRVLSRLTRAELLIQKRRADDKRSKALRLTPRGESVLAQTTRVVEETSPDLLAGLSPKDRRRLIKILGKLRAGNSG